MIDYYLESRATLRLVLLLIDSRREPTEEDFALIQWAEFHEKPILIVFTKVDKLKEQEKRKNLATALNAIKNTLHSTTIHFLHYSIKEPQGRMELIEKINGLLKEYGTNK